MVVGRQQATTIDANINRIEKLFEDTKEIYKNGFAEKLDVDKVNVTLNNLKTEREKVNNQLAAGNAALKFLMNMPQSEQLILVDSLTEDMIKSNLLDSTLDYNNRKDFQLLQTVKELNQFNIKDINSVHCPPSRHLEVTKKALSAKSSIF